MPAADRLPPLSLLAPQPDDDAPPEDRSDDLLAAFMEYGVDVAIGERHVGPQVVRYLATPGAGVLPAKVEKITDALSVRLGAPVRFAGQFGTALALEVGRERRAPVHLRQLLEHGPALASLGVAVGVDAGGHPLAASLTTLPHLLVGGATGQGKSVFVNAVLISLLMRNTPNELRLHLIDPKRVELAAYADLPHLAAPIATDAASAAVRLRAVEQAMDARYARMERDGVKTITEWNDSHDVRWWREVVVIDELADLILTGGRAVEQSIVRIAALGRAAGFHLVLATQYPKREVVTPLIKQNVPSQIAFMTNDHVASQLIIGAPGAEHLTGMGDALWSPVGTKDPVRVQTPFVSSDDVTLVVDWWKKKAPRADQAPVLARLREDRERDQEAAARVAALEEARRPEPAPAPAEAPRGLEAELTAEMIGDARLRAAGFLARLEAQERAIDAMNRTLILLAEALVASGVSLPEPSSTNYDLIQPTEGISA